MSELMTDERIDGIRRRAERATIGPWWVSRIGTEASIESEPLARFVCHLNSNMLRYSDDADFIAHARADIPDLLAELERIQGWGDNTMAGCLSLLVKAQTVVNGALEALGTGRGASDLLEEFDEAVRQLSAGRPEGKGQ